MTCLKYSYQKIRKKYENIRLFFCFIVLVCLLTCMLQILYRTGSPRQPCGARQRLNCCATPPSHEREHVDQFDHVDHPVFFTRFSTSVSTSGCGIHECPTPFVWLPFLELFCCILCLWWWLCCCAGRSNEHPLGMKPNEILCLQKKWKTQKWKKWKNSFVFSYYNKLI